MKIAVDNLCHHSKIDRQFLPIIPEAIKSYLEILPREAIQEIRLMGSVPRGQARTRESDIDFAVICLSEPTEKQIEALAQKSIYLSSIFRQVRKVDMEFEVIGSIHPARVFVLRTDSISIFGESTFVSSPLEIDPIEIANTNTPNINTLISRYRLGINSTADDQEIKQFSRWIGKDILKALRYRLLVEKGIYDRAPVEIRNSLVEFYPSHSSIFDNLIDVYLNPIDDISKLNLVLDEVEELKNKFEEFCA